MTSPVFSVGDLVKVAPHTDAFMRGWTVAEVVKVGRVYVHVRGMSLRVYDRRARFLPEHLTVVTFQRVSP